MKADSWTTGTKPSNAKMFATEPLDPRDDRRHALPDADTHRAQRVLLARRLERVRRGQQQSSARHAERVTERDSATVGVEPRVLIGQAQLSGAPQDLCRERFVELDD